MGKEVISPPQTRKRAHKPHSSVVVCMSKTFANHPSSFCSPPASRWGTTDLQDSQSATVSPWWGDVGNAWVLSVGAGSTWSFGPAPSLPVALLASSLVNLHHLTNSSPSWVLDGVSRPNCRGELLVWPSAHLGSQQLHTSPCLPDPGGYEPRRQPSGRDGGWTPALALTWTSICIFRSRPQPVGCLWPPHSLFKGRERSGRTRQRCLCGIPSPRPPALGVLRSLHPWSQGERSFGCFLVFWKVSLVKAGSKEPKWEEEVMAGSTASDCTTSGHSQVLKMEPCFQSDSLLPSPSTSLISQLLSNTMVGRSLDPCILFPSSQAVALPQDCECGASPGEGAQTLAFPRTRAAASVPSAGDRDQLSDQHLRAKRARVESIIQGMSLPRAFGTSLEAAFEHERERGGELPRESKRKPRVPQQGAAVAGRVVPIGGSPHAEGCQQLREQLFFLEQQLREQLFFLEQQLRRLQEKFSQVCDSGDAAQTQEGAEKAHSLPGKPGDRPDKDSAGATNDPCEVPLWRSILEVHGQEEEEGSSGTGGLPSATRVLSQALKHELAGVMSRVVDSVLKTVWPKAAGHLLQQHRSLPVPGPGARREYFAAGRCRKPLGKPSPMDALGSTQAEVLSGASGKSPGSHAGSCSSKGVRKPCRVPSMGYPLGSAAPIQDSQLLSQLLGCSQHSTWVSGSCRSPSALEGVPLEPLNLHWGTVKLRSSVVRQQQQQHPLSLSPADVESLVLLSDGRDSCGELQTAMDGAPFASTHIQEALTPSHLKKAKLMFFFTRYPSSTLLKTYFLDVQFSRCITSQLIKWFSNFREFYYIQVEKFARQALLEGIVDAAALQVSRDSELFRALNTHYNKGNDFEVPGRFLEVASLTLREFFSAVRAGKDADPSWKKPIYKIISKLDSDIPEGFKAIGCSQELLRS
ncbi:prospero homeobox protein 2 [Podargus strigoides]